MDPIQETLKRKVALALMSFNPLLHPAKFDYEQIARLQRISVDEAKLKNRQIELDNSEDSNRIQIMIFDNEAFISVPYWHTGKKVKEVFREIWEYLRIIQRETGYVAYDSQIGAILDLEQEYSQAMEVYNWTIDRMKKEIPNVILGNQNHQRKWWQFGKR